MTWFGFVGNLLAVALIEYVAFGAYGEFNVVRWSLIIWFCYAATLAMFVAYLLREVLEARRKARARDA
ncbi:hypothetical protein SRABI130_04555 [Pseudomonas sp. Bi130]|uniref:hypothetical protein n=1 Tax=Pseudomonas sp. Bi130 TaxID=2821122 RepID=UPI001D738B71|nr:hypothetical protein [Pseudomonas sp. Bi130]CAH0297253.1 hypothetical protein SRABI130_04555 [Pseudomonas sp. Bi130]